MGNYNEREIEQVVAKRHVVQDIKVGKTDKGLLSIILLSDSGMANSIEFSDDQARKLASDITSVLESK